jgi:hypothetical protein
MVDFARAISALGVEVITLTFPTWNNADAFRIAPVLEACYRA